MFEAHYLPQVALEVSYPEAVLLEPVDQLLDAKATFTDDSLSGLGGAAVWLVVTDAFRLVTIPCPQNRNHCELVTLCLAL